MPEISLLFLCALERLDADDREVVVNRVVTGESLATVAARMDVTRSAIQQRERKALAKLRRHLTDLGFER